MVLTAKAVAQAQAKIIAGWVRFMRMRLDDWVPWMRDLMYRQYPELAPSRVDELIAEEAKRERAFLKKQRERMRRLLPEALKEPNIEQRAEKVKRVLDREREYVRMREEAIVERALNAAERELVKQRSPLGAYWKLSPTVKEHTLDCILLGEKFWPWEVLDRIHPQLHPGCACSLLSYEEAIQRGYMTPDQIPDTKDAVLRAQAIIDATRNLSESVDEDEIVGYALAIQEADVPGREREYLRYPKGFERGGQFRPRRGGMPGARTITRKSLRKLRQVVPEPPATPADRRKHGAGRWVWMQGVRTFIPEYREFNRKIGTREFVSPPGSTNVYRDGKLVDTPGGGATHPSMRKGAAVEKLAAPQVDEQGLIAAPETVETKLAQELARYSIEKGYPPTRAGQPQIPTHNALVQQGYVVVAQRDEAAQPKENLPPLTTILYIHPESGAQTLIGYSTEGPGEVREVKWTPVSRLPPATKLDRPPKNFDEATQDAVGVLSDLSNVQDSVPFLAGFTVDPESGGTNGTYGWDGRIYYAPLVEGAIERVAQRREAGQEIPDDLKRVYYSANHTLVHEVLHAAFPIWQGDYTDRIYHRALEESVTEELAHLVMADRLRARGETDILEWFRNNPDKVETSGTYPYFRGAFDRLLSEAKIAPEQRKDYLWEFRRLSPEARINRLVEDVAKAQGRDVGETDDYVRAVLKASEHEHGPEQFAPILVPDLQDVPLEDSVDFQGKRITAGSKIKARRVTGAYRMFAEPPKPGEHPDVPVEEAHGTVVAVHQDDGDWHLSVIFEDGVSDGAITPDEIVDVLSAPTRITTGGHEIGPGDLIEYDNIADGTLSQARVNRIVRRNDVQHEKLTGTENWIVEAVTTDQSKKPGEVVYLTRSRVGDHFQQVSAPEGVEERGVPHQGVTLELDKRREQRVQPDPRLAVAAGKTTVESIEQEKMAEFVSIYEGFTFQVRDRLLKKDVTLRVVTDRPMLVSDGHYEVEGKILDEGGDHPENLIVPSRPVPLGTIHMSVEDGIVTHEGITLGRRYHGQGFAAAFNAHAEAEYRRLGYSQIKLTAVSAGSYAWARAGWEFDADWYNNLAQNLGGRYEDGRYEAARRMLSDVGERQVRTKATKGGVPADVIEDFLSRFPTEDDIRNGTLDDKFGSEFEIASYGREYQWREPPESRYALQKMWLGKLVMLDNTWQGTKPLARELVPAAGKTDDYMAHRVNEYGLDLYEVHGTQTSTRVFAALLHDRAEPLGVLTVDKDEGTVELVFVQENARGLGVATQLLDTARQATGLPLDKDTGVRSPLGAEWAGKRGLAGPDLGELRRAQERYDRAEAAYMAGRTPETEAEYDAAAEVLDALPDTGTLTDREATAIGSRMMVGLRSAESWTPLNDGARATYEKAIAPEGPSAGKERVYLDDGPAKEHLDSLFLARDDPWASRLDEYEQEALDSFRDPDGFQEINGLLRSWDEAKWRREYRPYMEREPEHVWERIASLDTAIEKAPPTGENLHLHLFRGVRDSTAMFGPDGPQIGQRLPPDPAFISTTTDVETARLFAQKPSYWMPEKPENPVMLEIDVPAGARGAWYRGVIEPLDEIASEFLLPRGVTLEVTGIYQEAGMEPGTTLDVVEMRYVPEAELRGMGAGKWEHGEVSDLGVRDNVFGGWWDEDVRNNPLFFPERPAVQLVNGREQALWKALYSPRSGSFHFWITNGSGNPHHDTVMERIDPYQQYDWFHLSGFGSDFTPEEGMHYDDQMRDWARGVADFTDPEELRQEFGYHPEDWTKDEIRKDLYDDLVKHVQREVKQYRRDLDDAVKFAQPVAAVRSDPFGMGAGKVSGVEWVDAPRGAEALYLYDRIPWIYDSANEKLYISKTPGSVHEGIQQAAPDLPDPEGIYGPKVTGIYGAWHTDSGNVFAMHAVGDDVSATGSRPAEPDDLTPDLLHKLRSALRARSVQAFDPTVGDQVGVSTARGMGAGKDVPGVEWVNVHSMGTYGERVPWIYDTANKKLWVSKAPGAIHANLLRGATGIPSDPHLVFGTWMPSSGRVAATDVQEPGVPARTTRIGTRSARMGDVPDDLASKLRQALGGRPVTAWDTEGMGAGKTTPGVEWVEGARGWGAMGERIPWLYDVENEKLWISKTPGSLHEDLQGQIVDMPDDPHLVYGSWIPSTGEVEALDVQESARTSIRAPSIAYGAMVDDLTDDLMGKLRVALGARAVIAFDPVEHMTVPVPTARRVSTVSSHRVLQLQGMGAGKDTAVTPEVLAAYEARSALVKAGWYPPEPGTANRDAYEREIAALDIAAARAEEVVGGRVYRMNDTQLALANKKMRDLARRATKLNLAEPTMTVVGTGTIPGEPPPGFDPALHSRPEEGWPLKPVSYVTVAGPEPKLKGWQFVATLQHLEGANVIRRVPGTGDDDLGDFRTGAPVCDWCKLARDRKDTFLVRKTTDDMEPTGKPEIDDAPVGAILQVGRNCLRDFLGHGDPNALAAYLERWYEFDDVAGADDEDEWGGGGSGGKSFMPITGYLTHVATMLRTEGWSPRSGYGKATADSARDNYYDWITPGRVATEPTKEDEAEAEAALDWARTVLPEQDRLSDFDHNLVAMASGDYVPERGEGILAYLPVAYAKAQEREIALARQKKQNAASEHVGEVGGKRLSLKLTVERVIPKDGQYGMTFITKLADEDGNLFTWFGSYELEQGATYEGMWGVKKHDEYQGTKQTVLTRPTKLERTAHIETEEGEAIIFAKGEQVRVGDRTGTIMFVNEQERKLSVKFRAGEQSEQVSFDEVDTEAPERQEVASTVLEPVTPGEELRKDTLVRFAGIFKYDHPGTWRIVGYTGGAQAIVEKVPAAEGMGAGKVELPEMELLGKTGSKTSGTQWHYRLPDGREIEVQRRRRPDGTHGLYVSHADEADDKTRFFDLVKAEGGGWLVREEGAATEWETHEVGGFRTINDAQDFALKAALDHTTIKPLGMGAGKDLGVPNTMGEAGEWVPLNVEVRKVETPGYLLSRSEVLLDGKRIGYVERVKSSAYYSIKGPAGRAAYWQAVDKRGRELDRVGSATRKAAVAALWRHAAKVEHEDVFKIAERQAKKRGMGAGKTDAALTTPLAALTLLDEDGYLTADTKDGVRVGLIQYKVHPEGVHLNTVAVAPEHQGRGYAVALVTELHRRKGGPVIHGGFSTAQGLGFGTYMAARYPDWNKMWLGFDADDGLEFWNPSEPLFPDFDFRLGQGNDYERPPQGLSSLLYADWPKGRASIERALASAQRAEGMGAGKEVPTGFGPLPGLRLQPLPMRNGLYYRVHRRDAPFGPEHASTVPNVPPGYKPVVPRLDLSIPKEGYSAVWNPHHLEQYVTHMGWTPEDDNVRVIAFEGTPVGEGYDGEPRVMPDSEKLVGEVEWLDFLDQLEVTPDGYGRYYEHTWGDGPDGKIADDGYTTLGAGAGKGEGDPTKLISTPADEGRTSSEYDTGDGRGHIELDDTFETECDDAHPVKFSQADREQYAKLSDFDKTRLSRENWPKYVALRDRKKGYLCPGGEPHYYSQWTVQVDGDWTEDVYDTFAQAKAVLEDRLGHKLTIQRQRKPKPEPVKLSPEDEEYKAILEDELAGLERGIASFDELLKGPDAPYADRAHYEGIKKRREEVRRLLDALGKPEGMGAGKKAEVEIRVDSWAGGSVTVDTPEDAIAAARTLWDEAGRAPGRPTINFYVNGKFVRTVNNRRDLEDPPGMGAGKTSDALPAPKPAHARLYIGTTNAGLQVAKQQGYFGRRDHHALANEIEDEYGLERDAVWNHSYFDYVRGSRALDTKVYSTDDLENASYYARALNESTVDALKTAHRIKHDDLMREIVAEQDRIDGMGLSDREKLALMSEQRDRWKSHEQGFIEAWRGQHPELAPTIVALDVPMTEIPVPEHVQDRFTPAEYWEVMTEGGRFFHEVPFAERIDTSYMVGEVDPEHVPARGLGMSAGKDGLVRESAVADARAARAQPGQGTRHTRTTTPVEGLTGLRDAQVIQSKEAGFGRYVDAYNEWTTGMLVGLTRPENGAKIAVRVEGSSLPTLIAEGRVRNAHHGSAHVDTTRSERSARYNEHRAELERAWFGIDADERTSPDAYPIYGYVTTDREAITSGGGRAFGDVKLTLRDDVRPRTTIVYSDSMYIGSGDPQNAVPSPVDDPSYLSVSHFQNLAGIEKPVHEEGDEMRPLPRFSPDEERAIEAASRGWGGGLSEQEQENLRDSKRWEIARETYGWTAWRHGDFIETQIHGGVRIPEDVERIDFEGAADPQVAAKLTELGIPFTEHHKPEGAGAGKDEVLDSLNPTGGIFVSYDPAARAAASLGGDLTTLDKTMGVDPDTPVTIYRGAPPHQQEIVSGDFVTTNSQLASAYAGSGHVIEKQVPASHVVDDSSEPLGEEYIYLRPVAGPGAGKFAFDRGARVIAHGRGSSVALGGDQPGTVERRRYNRWYARYEYLVMFDKRPEGLGPGIWLFDNDIDPMPEVEGAGAGKDLPPEGLERPEIAEPVRERMSAVPNDQAVYIAEGAIERAGLDGGLLGWRIGHPHHPDEAGRAESAKASALAQEISGDPTLKVHISTWGEGLASYSRFTHVVTVRPNSSKLSLLHEIAHAMTRTEHQDVDAHGPEFIRIARDLYREHLTPEAADIFWNLVGNRAEGMGAGKQPVTGEPYRAVMYHGTLRSNLDSIEQTGLRPDPDTQDIWLTDDVKNATGYAEGRYLDRGPGTVVRATVTLDNPFVIDRTGPGGRERDLWEMLPDEIEPGDAFWSDKLFGMGYDGIVHRGPGASTDVEVQDATKVTGAIGMSAGKETNIVVPDAPEFYGQQNYIGTELDRYGDQFGQHIRGIPISPHDERIPDTLYHATSNLPAVEAGGVLRARGEGGLGGDRSDKIVSLTTDREIAERIARDMRFVASMYNQLGPAPPYKSDERADWGERVVAMMQEHGRQEGFDWKPQYTRQEFDHQYKEYGMGDWLNGFLWDRETKAGIRNPIFWNVDETFAGIRPELVGIVEVPKASLNRGALVTDFDLHRGDAGLSEIRVYGDVEVGRTVALAAGMGAGKPDLEIAEVHPTVPLMAEIEAAKQEATNDPESVWNDIAGDARRMMERGDEYRILTARKDGKLVGAAVLTEQDAPGVEVPEGYVVFGRLASNLPGTGTALTKQAAQIAASQNKGLVGWAIPTSRAFFRKQGMQSSRAGPSTFTVWFDLPAAKLYAGNTEVVTAPAEVTPPPTLAPIPDLPSAEWSERPPAEWPAPARPANHAPSEFLTLPNKGKLATEGGKALATVDRLLRVPEMYGPIPVRATVGKNQRGGYHRVAPKEYHPPEWEGPTVRMTGFGKGRSQRPAKRADELEPGDRLVRPGGYRFMVKDVERIEKEIGFGRDPIERIVVTTYEGPDAIDTAMVDPEDATPDTPDELLGVRRWEFKPDELVAFDWKPSSEGVPQDPPLYPTEIRVSVFDDEPIQSAAATLVHEQGHYIDNQAFTQYPFHRGTAAMHASWLEYPVEERDKFLNELREKAAAGDEDAQFSLVTMEFFNANPAPLSEWYKAANESPEARRLATAPSIQDYGTHKYLLSPVELWARSFTQWVATRSGEPEWRDWLDHWQNQPSSGRWRQRTTWGGRR